MTQLLLTKNIYLLLGTCIHSLAAVLYQLMRMMLMSIPSKSTAAAIVAFTSIAFLLPSTEAFISGAKTYPNFVTPSSTKHDTFNPRGMAVQALNMSTKPKSGDVVTASFKLEPNGDFIPDALFDDGTVSFVLDGGNYLPSIHELLSSLSVGETSDEVTVDAGWGDRRDELIAQVPIASSGLKKDDLKVGMELYLANGMQCRITEIGEENFTIDANPPLAGASYTTKVTLDSVEGGPSEEKFVYSPTAVDDGSKYDVMTIALGCFWGGELEYMRVPGVVGTAVGYTQGEKLDPTYKEVCSGTTGHTEAIQVIFDPEVASYQSLVSIGLERLGDSRTLLNQVGNDRGTQYRHGIYYHNDKQKEVAESIIGSYGEKCVTECKAAVKFYRAEDYHQQYLLKGGQSAKKNAKETIRCYG